MSRIIINDSNEQELFTEANPGYVDVKSVAVPSAIYCGRNTVASHGTAEALGGSRAVLSGVTVKALAGNAGDVYVGNSGVKNTNGFVLSPGDQVFVEVGNIATVYIDSAQDGDGVSYIGS